MSRRKKRGRPQKDRSPGSASPASEGHGGDTQGRPHENSESVSAGEWTDRKRLIRRAFPGPGGVEVPLRVAFERQAHAELIAHAKESVDAEVCGVLVGDVCEDNEGVFLHIRAVIRGSTARRGSGHVTFAHETWSAIHRALEDEYSTMQMVGWYHSHPGFGVEFSDMDVFIQENFFSAPTQIALVTDPLRGDEAMCVNTPEGLRAIDRFWIDGREQRCRSAGGGSRVTTPGDAGLPDGASEDLRAVQDRLSQLVQALDQQHASVYRTLLALGMVVAFAIVVWIGFNILFHLYGARRQPPRLRQYVPVDLQIDDRTVRLGIGVYDWEVPPELDLAVELEALKRLIREKEEAAAAGAPSQETEEETGEDAEEKVAPQETL